MIKYCKSLRYSKFLYANNPSCLIYSQIKLIRLLNGRCLILGISHQQLRFSKSAKYSGANTFRNSQILIIAVF